ncbi:hypothetical protein B0H14DRAFT_2576782 [Mycena olivaceomarginata]|nr:hypothetical protein B0H14DRAFT_2576782 [Mycena olivaceomarginata]
MVCNALARPISIRIGQADALARSLDQTGTMAEGIIEGENKLARPVSSLEDGLAKDIDLFRIPRSVPRHTMMCCQWDTDRQHTGRMLSMTGTGIVTAGTETEMADAVGRAGPPSDAEARLRRIGTRGGAPRPRGSGTQIGTTAETVPGRIGTTETGLGTEGRLCLRQQAFLQVGVSERVYTFESVLGRPARRWKEDGVAEKGKDMGEEKTERQ